jgi:CDP-6-deoxy-D-xylo-4-hexulose-3-dehydrase
VAPKFLNEDLNKSDTDLVHEPILDVRHALSRNLGEKSRLAQFQFGDLVTYRFSSNAGNQVENLGLVYDAKGDEIRVLHMSPIAYPDYLRRTSIGKMDLVDGSLQKNYYVMLDRMLLIPKDSVLKLVGRINTTKMDEVLRQIMYDVVEKHYEAVHKESELFVPHKTYLPYSGTVYDSEDMKTLADATLDFRLSASRFAKQLEEGLAKFLGVKYCMLTNSGSSANLLAISALTAPELNERRLKPGDEVITAACAFPTTVNPIIQNNAVPVFVDVDLGTYNIQPDKVEGAISDKTKAVFLAHTLGNPFDLGRITKICRSHGLWLIEDNCDALGSRYQGKYTGTFGDIATLSFYPPHHITMGEGGALVTNDAELKRLILSFRDWGRDCWCEPGSDNTCGKRFGWQLGALPYGYDHKYIYSHIGYNLKVTDMQAAVGVSQLRKLSHFIEARKANWKLLYEGLKQYDKHFILPKPTDRSDPSWFGFAVTIKEGAPFTRNEIVSHLENNGVATRLVFSGNITRHPSFHDVKFRVCGDLKNTDTIAERTFWIGVYPGLTREMIAFMLSEFGSFMRTK